MGDLQRKHGGQAFRLYVDVAEAGSHVIAFSMREDGTEFDKSMMTKQRLEKVEGHGPPVRLKKARLAERADAKEREK